MVRLTLQGQGFLGLDAVLGLGFQDHSKAVAWYRALAACLRLARENISRFGGKSIHLSETWF
jgi:hypothetical protein